MSEQDNKIENFWNENPVGNNFIGYHADKKFYEDYDEFRYRTEGHILSELNQIDFRGKRVLEIGLGQGADSMQIIQRGATYYGIELTDESVKRLKERFSLFNLPFKEVVKANAQTIPYENDFFDIVYSHGVIHHSPEIVKIVSEIRRVLKPQGKAVIMMYHKNSFNYYISICFLRRVGLMALLIFPFLTGWVSKITGESVERINGHRENFRVMGCRYFTMKEFLHKSTDGPSNVYSSVWNRESSASLFKEFRNLQFRVHFLNERHMFGFHRLLSRKFKERMAEKYGWHLWIYAEK
jgi:ubiquinone/menaquinone biosynthesis C-methylase UbiE